MVKDIRSKHFKWTKGTTIGTLILKCATKSAQTPSGNKRKTAGWVAGTSVPEVSAFSCSVLDVAGGAMQRRRHPLSGIAVVAVVVFSTDYQV